MNGFKNEVNMVVKKSKLPPHRLVPGKITFKQVPDMEARIEKVAQILVFGSDRKDAFTRVTAGQPSRRV